MIHTQRRLSLLEIEITFKPLQVISQIETSSLKQKHKVALVFVGSSLLSLIEQGGHMDIWLGPRIVNPIIYYISVQIHVKAC